jgi:hypothetical protein
MPRLRCAWAGWWRPSCCSSLERRWQERVAEDVEELAIRVQSEHARRPAPASWEELRNRIGEMQIMAEESDRPIPLQKRGLSVGLPAFLQQGWRLSALQWVATAEILFPIPGMGLRHQSAL